MTTLHIGLHLQHRACFALASKTDAIDVARARDGRYNIDISNIVTLVSKIRYFVSMFYRSIFPRIENSIFCTDTRP